MRLLNQTESAEWCERLNVELDQKRQPSRQLSNPHRLHCAFPPSFPQLLWFSRVIESALQPRQACLLWVTGYGIFPSNENQHLYYRLRQSYGDTRLLHEAPGHLYLDYERPDVVTLLHLSILFGWDVHVIPSVGYGRAFVCHDEWIDIGFDDGSKFAETRKELERAKLRVSVPTTV
jgi:hypothetical protein